MPEAPVCLIASLDPPPAPEALLRALSLTDATSLVVVPKPGHPPAIDTLRDLVQRAQAAGVAVLIQDDPDLAKAAAADGVHLTWDADIHARYHDARTRLGASAIVGGEAGSSRHDAMVLGENGADYVAFASAAGTDDPGDARERRRELVAWWAEIFEIPVVAFGVGDAAEAADLRAAGADFVAVPFAPDATSMPEIDAWARSTREMLLAVAQD